MPKYSDINPPVFSEEKAPNHPVTFFGPKAPQNIRRAKEATRETLVKKSAPSETAEGNGRKKQKPKDMPLHFSLTDRAKIRIFTAAPAKTLNALKKAGIPARRVTIGEGFLEMQLSSRFVPRLHSALKGQKCRIRIREKTGQQYFRQKASRRWSFFFGAAMAAVFLYAAFGLVWGVQVLPAQGIDPEEVAHRVGLYGYGFGTLWSNFDSDALVQRLETDYPEMMYIEARQNGILIQVEMAPRTFGTPIFDRGQPVHIVAARDGVVRQIVTLAGRAVVQPGDRVTAGQVLIEGWGSGAEGMEIPLHAQGFVQGEILLQASGSSPLVKTEFLPTGKSAETRHLSVLGFAIGEAEQVPFASCRCATEKIAIPGAWGIPLYVVRRTFLETKPSFTPLEEGAAREQAQKEAAEKLIQLLPENAIYVDKTMEFSNMEGREVRCRVSLSVLCEIGRERQFTPIASLKG